MKTIPLIAVFFVFYLTGCATKILHLEFISNQVDEQVYGLYFEDSKNSAEYRNTSILILPGANGVLHDYHPIAQNLADHGYSCLLLDYYDDGKHIDPKPGLHVGSDEWKLWIQNVGEAIDLLTRRDPGNRIAIVGFSRGATLAYQVAAQDKRVDALIVYYGIPYSYHPEETINSVDETLKALPATLAIQAGSDNLLSVDRARAIHKKLLDAGVDARLEILANAEHSFIFRTYPEVYNEEAVLKAEQFLLDFLERKCR